MRGRFRDVPLAKRILIMFVVGVLVPNGIFFTWFFRYTVSGFYDRFVEDNLSMLSMAAQSIESNIALVENVIEILAYDRNLVSLLSNRNLSAYERVVLQLVDVAEAAANAQMFISSLEGDIIIFSQSDRVMPSYWRYLSIEMAETMPDYQRYRASGRGESWIGVGAMRPEGTTLQPSDQKYLFTYYHDILSGFSRVGCIKCGVSPARLFAVVDMWEGEGSLSVWFEESLAYGLAPYPDMFSHIDAGARVQQYGDQVIMLRPLAGSDLQLALCISGASLTRQTMINTMPQIIMTICMCLLFLSVVLLLLHSVRKRLTQGVEFARQAKVNNMDIAFPDMGNDEVGQLIGAFNALLQRLQATAHDRIAREESEKTALLLALQYQINPHFLFNTLNWLQLSIELKEDSVPLGDAVGYLGKILRYNLKGESTASLREEIENTANYVRLMNLRKHGLIVLTADVEGLPAEMRLLRFVFQPLMENAIQHGMYPGRQLHVWVRGRQEEGFVHFTVENNGRPIAGERLGKLRMDIEQAKTGKGVGLANIAARLRLLYGEDTRFDVHSEQGITRISFRFRMDAPLKIADYIKNGEEDEA